MLSIYEKLAARIAAHDTTGKASPKVALAYELLEAYKMSEKLTHDLDRIIKGHQVNRRWPVIMASQTLCSIRSELLRVIESLERKAVAK